MRLKSGRVESSRVESSRDEVVRTNRAAATTSTSRHNMPAQPRGEGWRDGARRGETRRGNARRRDARRASHNRVTASESRGCCSPPLVRAALISDKQRVTRYQLHRKTEFTKLAAARRARARPSRSIRISHTDCFISIEKSWRSRRPLAELILRFLHLSPYLCHIYIYICCKYYIKCSWYIYKS